MYNKQSMEELQLLVHLLKENGSLRDAKINRVIRQLAENLGGLGDPETIRAIQDAYELGQVPDTRWGYDGRRMSSYG